MHYGLATIQTKKLAYDFKVLVEAKFFQKWQENFLATSIDVEND